MAGALGVRNGNIHDREPYRRIVRWIERHRPRTKTHLQPGGSALNSDQPQSGLPYRPRAHVGPAHPRQLLTAQRFKSEGKAGRALIRQSCLAQAAIRKSGSGPETITFDGSGTYQAYASFMAQSFRWASRAYLPLPLAFSGGFRFPGWTTDHKLSASLSYLVGPAPTTKRASVSGAGVPEPGMDQPEWVKGRSAP